jgi:hypothetical protein
MNGREKVILVGKIKRCFISSMDQAYIAYNPKFKKIVTNT